MIHAKQVFKIAVFAYNFPHKKTQDVLTRLFFEGYKVTLVIACDWVELKIPPAAVRTRVRHSGLLPPSVVAKGMGAAYHVTPHNSEETIRLLRRFDIDLAIIAGARILKKNVIDACKFGVINFHPGLLPEVRGLDTLLWSVYENVPLGVTAHLIDEHIDAGTILQKKTIPVYPDDTAFDLSERLQESQLDMIAPSIEAVFRRDVPKSVVNPHIRYHRKMPANLEKHCIDRLPSYVERQAAANKLQTQDMVVRAEHGTTVPQG